MKFVSQRTHPRLALITVTIHEQKGITITHTQLDGAGHFYEEPFMDPMIEHVTTYVKRRLTENTR